MPVAVTEAGHNMTGGWLSTTVMAMTQVVELLAASVARKVTLVVPTEKAEPLAGPLMRVVVPLVGAQLSVKVGFE